MEASRTGTFRKLLEKDPNNPMVRCSLGIELFKEGNYTEAREHLSHAVELKPDYSVAHKMLGRTYYELHENRAARETFDRGREVAGENGDLQTVREIGVFLNRLDKREAGGSGDEA